MSAPRSEELAGLLVLKIGGAAGLALADIVRDA